MTSTFTGINTAYSGLSASQTRMNVTSNNIANADTEGYTRQRAETVEAGSIYVAGVGYVGTGADVETITQLRDEFLDSQYRDENSSYGEWSVKADVLGQVEDILDELSGTGLLNDMDNFYNALVKLSSGTNTDDTTMRALVRENAILLTQTLNQYAESLTGLQEDVDYKIEVLVGEVNDIADQIAKLNEQIYSSELDGNKANDLRDERNLLLDELSEIVPVQYYEDSNGKLNVLVDGIALVNHDRSNHLVLTERSTKVNASDADGLSDVQWESGQSFEPSSGSLKGLLEVRDNVSGDTKGIPYYLDCLNEFADTLASSINEIHREGYGLEGSTGTYFFTINGMSSTEYEQYIQDNGGSVTILASEISISSDIENDLNKIAASTELDELPGNGENALAMADTKDDSDMFEWGNPEDFITSLASTLGVQVRGAESTLENEQTLLDSIDYKRQSVSSVSTDEEMANLVVFQNAYNANARMMTTLDEMLDKLINGTGVVGR